jgi:hypothetical protein
MLQFSLDLFMQLLSDTQSIPRLVDPGRSMQLLVIKSNALHQRICQERLKEVHFPYLRGRDSVVCQLTCTAC